MDVTARHNSAGCVVERHKRGARSAQCGTARGKLRASRARQRPVTPLATGVNNVGPRRAAGHRNSSPTEIRGTKTVCALGARHGHPWTSRRGARVRAASSHAQYRSDARKVHDVARRAENVAREAAARDTAGKGRDRRWATAGGRATQPLPAENRKKQFATWARNATILERRGAAQECHKTGARRAKRAMWHEVGRA